MFILSIPAPIAFLIWSATCSTGKGGLAGGGGGGGSAVNTISTFIEEDLTNLNGSELIISDYSNLISNFQNIVSEGEYSSLSAVITGPNSEDIKKAYSYFIQNKSNFQISCTKFGWMNPWWAATLGIDGQPSMIFPEHFNKRSQDLPTLFCPTGAFWIADAKSLKKYNSYYMNGYSFFKFRSRIGFSSVFCSVFLDKISFSYDFMCESVIILLSTGLAIPR